MTYRDQALRDIEARAQRATDRHSTPAVINTGTPSRAQDIADARWLVGDAFVVIKLQHDFEVASARFPVMVDAGVAGDPVSFTFCGGVMRPREAANATSYGPKTPTSVDGVPTPAQHSVFIIPGLTKIFTPLRTAVNPNIAHVEVFFDTPVRLGKGIWYAFGFYSETGVEYFLGASQHDGAFLPRGVGSQGEPSSVIDIIASEYAGPNIELRSEEATRFLTGGAAYVRY